MALQRQTAIVILSLEARKERSTGLEWLWVDEAHLRHHFKVPHTSVRFSQSDHVLPFLSDYITTLEFARQVGKMNINSVLLEEQGRNDVKSSFGDPTHPSQSLITTETSE